MMECKKCGKKLVNEECRKVADWHFCQDCFQALMDEADEKHEEREETASNGSILPSQSTSNKEKCMVCGKEMKGGGGRYLLGLLFCQDCYEVLVQQPAVQPVAEHDEEEAEPKVAQVRVDIRKNTQCRGCNRQIPLLGSKEFNGHPYCPDCYHALPEIIALAPKPFPKAEAAMEEGAGPICQACNRGVSPENLKTIEGFEICRSCLAVDPGGALEIARARHRSIMEEMKKKLGI